MIIPKYKYIYDEIRKNILTSKWPVGSSMKSENELIEIFKVSRITIRNVLSMLENEGRIKRSRGKKTLILNRLLRNKANSAIKNFSANVKDSYSLQEFIVISNNQKNFFYRSPSLYYVERILRLKDENTYLISKAYISKNIAGIITKEQVRDRNLLDILINSSKIKLKKSNQEIKAINLSPKDAIVFKSIKGVPALSNTWYFYDLNDNVVLMDEEIMLQSLKVSNKYY